MSYKFEAMQEGAICVCQFCHDRFKPYVCDDKRQWLVCMQCHDRTEHLDKARQENTQQGVQWIDLTGFIDGDWSQGGLLPCRATIWYLITGPNDE